MTSNKGITLIELLLVIVIVGILAAIALPTYTSYTVRARRVDAKTALQQLQASQEMFRAERGRYANDGSDGNGLLTLQTSWGVPSNPVGDYNLLFQVCNANSFTAQAQPYKSRQLADGSLYINNQGQKWDDAGKYYPDPYSKWVK